MGLRSNKINYDEMEKYSIDICENIFGDSFDKILFYIEDNENQIVKEIQECILDILNKSSESQKNGEKDDIETISIFCMNYYYYIKKEPILIYAFDKRGYLDKTECFSSLNFEYIFSYYQKDVNKIKKILNDKYIRIPKEYLDKFFRKYLILYFGVIRIIFELYSDKIEESIKNHSSKCKENVVITFGQYMDVPDIINDNDLEEAVE